MDYVDIPIYKGGYIKKWNDMYDTVNWKKTNYKNSMYSTSSFYKTRVQDTH